MARKNKWVIERILCKEVALWAEDEDAWTEAVRDNWQHPEVMQWYAIEERFTRYLREQGEVIGRTFDLDLWGRQGCDRISARITGDTAGGGGLVALLR